MGEGRAKVGRRKGERKLFFEEKLIIQEIVLSLQILIDYIPLQ